MPRTKKTVSRSRDRSRGGYGNREDLRGLRASFIPFKGTESSVQSEALNTQHQLAPWDSDRRLRHAKINFVSARDSEHLKPTDPDIPLAEMPLNDAAEITSRDQEEVKFYPRITHGAIIIQEEYHTNLTQSEATEPFVIDSKSGDPVVTGFSPPQIRTPSPLSSDSADEIILFRGRNNAGKSIRKPPHLADDNALFCTPNVMGHDVMLQRRGLAAVNTLSKERSTLSRSRSIATPAELPAAVKDGLLNTLLQPYPPTLPKATESGYSSRARSRRSSVSRRSCQTKRDHEQTLFEDYIQNIDTQVSSSEMAYNQRDLGGTDSDTWQENDASSGDNFENLLQTELGRSELCDLNKLSMSDESHGSIQAILSKQERKAGLQYLVVWEGHSMEEACWVSTSALTDAKAMALIKQFEAKKKLVAKMSGGEDMDSDSDSDDDLTGDEGLGSTNDDIDLRQLNLERITDEHVARLLARRGEFDMGSADLIPDDGSPKIDMYDGDMPIPVTSDRSRHQLGNESMTKRSKGEFRAGSALADAYDGFDILDFERPSLKNKPKGRKGKLAFDLSNSGLEAAMQSTWDNDRSRKKQRKIQRQELRTQGLLGKKDTPDLKVKYKEGMGIQAVTDEIKSFLISDKSTLTLPPMEKADRKIVHEIANAFNLKSKSVGNGHKRFPVLYRTSNTSPYIEGKFASVEARLTHRFLPRMDPYGKSHPSVSKRSGRGGSANAAVAYKDGDIVGGSAPEIGIENRGRAMLEKMGWSTGTALGALNNKGILEPVPHVVKTTKAGLG